MNEGIHLDLDTWIVPGQICKANLCRGPRHHPLTPIQLINGSVTVPKANTFVQNMHERISQAKLCLQQAQARQKAYADTHRRDISFTEGDQITQY